jgi:hypothetical protein
MHAFRRNLEHPARKARFCQQNVLNSHQSLGSDLQKFMLAGETFGWCDSSIQVQLIWQLFQARFEKPRGGSRGAMTRSLSGR